MKHFIYSNDRCCNWLGFFRCYFYTQSKRYQSCQLIQEKEIVVIREKEKVSKVTKISNIKNAK